MDDTREPMNERRNEMRLDWEPLVRCLNIVMRPQRATFICKHPLAFRIPQVFNNGVTVDNIKLVILKGKILLGSNNIQYTTTNHQEPGRPIRNQDTPESLKPRLRIRLIWFIARYSYLWAERQAVYSPAVPDIRAATALQIRPQS